MCKITVGGCLRSGCSWTTDMYNPCTSFIYQNLSDSFGKVPASRTAQIETNLGHKMLWRKVLPYCPNFVNDESGIAQQVLCAVHMAEEEYMVKLEEANKKERQKESRRIVKHGDEACEEAVRIKMRTERWALEAMQKIFKEEGPMIKEGDKLTTTRLAYLHHCKLCNKANRIYNADACFLKIGPRVTERLLHQFQRTILSPAAGNTATEPTTTNALKVMDTTAVIDLTDKSDATAEESISEEPTFSPVIDSTDESDATAEESTSEEPTPYPSMAVQCFWIDVSHLDICHTCLRNKNVEKPDVLKKELGDAEELASGMKALGDTTVSEKDKKDAGTKVFEEGRLPKRKYKKRISEKDKAEDEAVSVGKKGKEQVGDDEEKGNEDMGEDFAVKNANGKRGAGSFVHE